MRMGLIKQNGFTLLESILVLSIASAILMLSVRQYQSYKLDSDVNQVLYNVDQLFQAASYYYQANCRNQVNQTTMAPIAGSGRLDPANSPANPLAVNPYTTLYSGGYLKQIIPDNNNPIVFFNLSGSPMKSYVVQFNLKTPPDQKVVNISGGGTANVGTIYVWKIQVAVRLKDPAKASQYLSLLRGECLSRMIGSTVVPCPAVPAAPVAGDDYVVFERLPSLLSSEGDSGLTATNAMVKQFNQQYTTYPILYLTSGVTPVTPQNYLCGT